MFETDNERVQLSQAEYLDEIECKDNCFNGDVKGRESAANALIRSIERR